MSKTSAELRADLAAMEAELPALHAAVAAGQAADRRLRQIGHGHKWGLMGGIYEKIAAIEAAEKQAAIDATLRKAVIRAGDDTRTRVVIGVTTDYVSTRCLTGSCETRKYSTRSGECATRWDHSTLDIPATFPEGIEAYRKAAKVKK